MINKIISQLFDFPLNIRHTSFHPEKNNTTNNIFSCPEKCWTVPMKLFDKCPFFAAKNDQHDKTVHENNLELEQKKIASLSQR